MTSVSMVLLVGSEVSQNHLLAHSYNVLEAFQCRSWWQGLGVTSARTFMSSWVHLQNLEQRPWPEARAKREEQERENLGK